MSAPRKLLFLALFLSASSLTLPQAFANLSHGVCKADADKFCASITGRGERMKCLSERQSELSSACQEKIQKIKARQEAFRTDCGADVQKFCADSGTDFWNQKKCLRTHENDLAFACTAHMTKWKK